MYLQFFSPLTRDMETWNKLTAAKGEEEEGNGGKKGKRLVKEHAWMTDGQQRGDGLWEQELGCVDESKGGKLGQL